MKHFLLAAAAAITIAPIADAQDYCNCLPIPIEERNLHLVSGVNVSAGSVVGPGNIGKPVEEVAPVVGASCGADQYQHLIGFPAIIADQLGTAGTARVLRPGDITTMVYISERMNIAIDEHETIDRVYCG